MSRLLLSIVETDVEVTIEQKVSLRLKLGINHRRFSAGTGFCAALKNLLRRRVRTVSGTVFPATITRLERTHNGRDVGSS